MPFVVGKVVECGPVPGKDKLKKLLIDVGATEPLCIVTNAPNIRDGTRTVVALVGTELEVNGEAITARSTAVGGVTSNGMVCDSTMLGWAGGAAGVAVQVPDSYALGAPAPTSKPRMDGGGGGAAVEAVEAAPELSAKELKAQENAARKAANAEKKAARKAAKVTGGKEGEGEEKDEDDEEDEEKDDKKVAGGGKAGAAAAKS